MEFRVLDAFSLSSEKNTSAMLRSSFTPPPTRSRQIAEPERAPVVKPFRHSSHIHIIRGGSILAG